MFLNVLYKYGMQVIVKKQKKLFPYEQTNKGLELKKMTNIKHEPELKLHTYKQQILHHG